MNIDQIGELARILSENGLTALEVTEGEHTVRLEKTPFAPAMAVPAAPVQPLCAAEAPAAKEQQTAPEDRLREVKSPMVGVFFSAPSPGEEPFVALGDRVKKGDVLCIIEAMKLMNEIVAPHDGTVEEICVSDGEVVEFSQTLFRLS